MASESLLSKYKLEYEYIHEPQFFRGVAQRLRRLREKRLKRKQERDE